MVAINKEKNFIKRYQKTIINMENIKAIKIWEELLTLFSTIMSTTTTWIKISNLIDKGFQRGLKF